MTEEKKNIIFRKTAVAALYISTKNFGEIDDTEEKEITVQSGAIAMADFLCDELKRKRVESIETCYYALLAFMLFAKVNEGVIENGLQVAEEAVDMAKDFKLFIGKDIKEDFVNIARFYASKGLFFADNNNEEKTDENIPDKAERIAYNLYEFVKANEK